MEHGNAVLNVWRGIKVCVWRVDKIEINKWCPLESKSGFLFVVYLVHKIKTPHLHLSSAFALPHLSYLGVLLKQRNSTCDGAKAKLGLHSLQAMVCICHVLCCPPSSLTICSPNPLFFTFALFHNFS